MYKSILATALTLGLAIASQAQASLFSLTTSGTISYGYDHAGIFGAPTNDLSGMEYSLTLSADPTLNPYQYSGNGYDYSYGGSGYGGAAVPVNITATVNNHTYNTTISNPYFNEEYVADSINSWWGSLSQVYADTYSYDENWIMTNRVYEYLYSYSNHFLVDATLGQSVNYTAQSGDYGTAYFYVENGNTYFQATPTAFVLNGATAVPEPAALGLLALGLCGVVGMRRHQRVASI